MPLIPCLFIWPPKAPSLLSILFCFVSFRLCLCLYLCLVFLDILLHFEYSKTSEKTRVTGYDYEERVCSICYDNLRSDIKFFQKVE